MQGNQITKEKNMKIMAYHGTRANFTFDEMSFVPNDPKRPSISSYHPDGPLVLMADGSTRSIKGIAPEVLRAMLQHMPDGDK